MHRFIPALLLAALVAFGAANAAPQLENPFATVSQAVTAKP